MITIRTENGDTVGFESFVFNGGEVQIKITDVITLENIPAVTITAHLTDSNKFFELAEIVDALRRINPDIKINLVCPYLPYARQDRAMVNGESLALKVFTNFLNFLNFNRIEVWDAHSDVTLALVDRVTNKGPEYFLEKVFDKLSFEEINNYILVSPDAGAMKKVGKVAKKFNLPMFTASKIRNVHNGDITGTEILFPIHPKHGQKFLIVDDICDGGMTFIKLAEAIIQNPIYQNWPYEKWPIELYVTHGIFSKGLDVLFNAGISKIYTANPFPKVNLTDPRLVIVGK